MIRVAYSVCSPLGIFASWFCECMPTLAQDEREELRGALVEEMTSAGLRADDEPTDYGRRLDDLIGRLAAF
jgi:hypothetical protein